MDDLEYFFKEEEHYAKIRAGLFHRCSGAMRITPELDDVYFS